MNDKIHKVHSNRCIDDGGVTKAMLIPSTFPCVWCMLYLLLMVTLIPLLRHRCFHTKFASRSLISVSRAFINLISYRRSIFRAILLTHGSSTALVLYCF